MNMAKILIVDDSSIMRRNLRAILRDGGHLVIAEASNGLEAYQAYKEYQPDLVTMDITMPVMDGIDAVRKIIVEFPTAQIIMISALNQRSKVFEALECGAKNYITKPIDASKVLSTVNETIGANSSISQKKEAVKNDKKDEIEAIDHNIEPFVIGNKNGVFIIAIAKHFKLDHMANLEMAVQGLLFIKPLTVVLNVKTFDEISEEACDRIVDLIKKIRSSQGMVKLLHSEIEFPSFVHKYEFKPSTPVKIEEGYISVLQ